MYVLCVAYMSQDCYLVYFSFFETRSGFFWWRQVGSPGCVL